MTTEFKQRILVALADKRQHFTGSDEKFATSLGIDKAQYNRVKKHGVQDKVLSVANWIRLARICKLAIGNEPDWVTVETPTHIFIKGQLEYCQENSSSRLMCDVTDIGKTFTAELYSRSNKNAVYVDCSQVKTKVKLIRKIAMGFGVGHTGKFDDVYADLVFYIQSLDKPLIILDEAGDLDTKAFLELKALWNATVHACGWYMMGADGLREKMRRSIDCKTVGYTELFSRYGSRYQKASPDSAQELNDFRTVHCAMIIKANYKGDINMQQLISRSDFSLRRVYDELRKLNAQ